MAFVVSMALHRYSKRGDRDHHHSKPSIGVVTEYKEVQEENPNYLVYKKVSSVVLDVYTAYMYVHACSNAKIVFRPHITYYYEKT